MPAAPAGPCGVRYLRLPVLDRQLHRDPQPLPVARGLGDVIAHLLGGLRDDTWRSHRARLNPRAPALPAAPSPCAVLPDTFPPGWSSTAPLLPRARFPPPSELFPRDLLIPPQQDALPTPPGTSFTAPLPGHAPLGLPIPAPPVPGTYQPQGSDLGGQRGRGSDLSAGAAQVNCGDSAASAAPARPRDPRPPPAPAAGTYRL